ncbi:hypothetical protein ACTFIU_001620 [Dictyostelium citrinum]
MDRDTIIFFVKLLVIITVIKYLIAFYKRKLHPTLSRRNTPPNTTFSSTQTTPSPQSSTPTTPLSTSSSSIMKPKRPALLQSNANDMVVPKLKSTQTTIFTNK